MDNGGVRHGSTRADDIFENAGARSCRNGMVRAMIWQVNAPIINRLNADNRYLSQGFSDPIEEHGNNSAVRIAGILAI
ncbi:hypothetical protein [Novosphingobium sp. SG919]|nr:hypothetical protein [Novosphingobium sp. SG919]